MYSVATCFDDLYFMFDSEDAATECAAEVNALFNKYAANVGDDGIFEELPVAHVEETD